jgi:hypothetical protein
MFYQYSTLLPLRGNKKREFGLWVAGATHVGTLLPLRGNKKTRIWAVGCGSNLRQYSNCCSKSQARRRDGG